MTDKQLTILEAVRALTVGDCPTRREAVKTIREYYEAESKYHKAVDEYREAVKKYTLPISVLDKIRAEIVHLHDWAFDRDGVLKIVDKYREPQAERSGEE